MRKHSFWLILWLLIFAAPLTIAAILPEPFNGILFLLVLPGLAQVYKIWRDRGGKPMSKIAKQAMALILAIVFTVLAGGFLGLEWPAAPAWESEIFKFIGDCLTFAADVIAVVGGAWTSLSGLYEGVLKRIFETFGFGTETAVAARRATGFWG